MQPGRLPLSHYSLTSSILLPHGDVQVDCMPTPPVQVNPGLTVQLMQPVLLPLSHASSAALMLSPQTLALVQVEKDPSSP